MREIHQQEGEIIEHVDAGEGLAELDAVEERRPPVQEDDVAEMKIAVAMPDLALIASCVEQGADLREHHARGCGEILDRLRIQRRRCLAQIAVVLPDGVLDGGASAMPGSERGGGMEGDDRIGQVAHELGRELARVGEPIEQVALGEAPHLDHPVDDGALAVEGQTAVAAPGDRVESQIEIGRGPQVELELLAAERGAPSDRRIVEIGEADHALQLVGAIPSQEEDRNVSLGPLDGGAGRAVARAIGEERDRLTLVIHHAAPGSP